MEHACLWENLNKLAFTKLIMFVFVNHLNTFFLTLTIVEFLP